jgi:hypothetical protein
LVRRHMYEEGSSGPGWWELRSWLLLRDRVEGMRVARATTRWYVDMYGPPNSEGWEATQTFIGRMHEEAFYASSRFLVVLLPLLVDLEGDYPFKETADNISEAVRERGAAFHDTTPAVLGQETTELWVHPADHHPNELAHELIARDLVQPVRRALP